MWFTHIWKMSFSSSVNTDEFKNAADLLLSLSSAEIVISLLSWVHLLSHLDNVITSHFNSDFSVFKVIIHIFNSVTDTFSSWTQSLYTDLCLIIFSIFSQMFFRSFLTHIHSNFRVTSTAVLTLIESVCLFRSSVILSLRKNVNVILMLEWSQFTWKADLESKQ